MNTYTPYYLRFATPSEADSILDQVGYRQPIQDTDPIEYYYTVGDGVPGGVDVIGEIWNNDGEYSDPDPATGEIEVISEPTKLAGWHVNVILAGPLPSLLEEYLVTPTTPNRRFAGF
jgi:hypothetical protein